MTLKNQGDTEYDDLPEFAEVVNRVFGTTIERAMQQPEHYRMPYVGLSGGRLLPVPETNCSIAEPGT